MKYDFDSVINRRGTNAAKWDVPASQLPMWVADMDFRAAPEIIAALQARLDHGVFGYTDTPDTWRQAIADWWYYRHGWAVQPDWLTFCTGVVPALSSLTRTLAEPGANVVIQAPVYHLFDICIRNSGRVPVSNDLLYRKGGYQINWKDLTAKLADPDTHLMVLCNPQNPTGNVWSADQLARLGELAAANDVIVVADEIHCDLTMPGVTYTPFASVNAVNAANSVTLVAPTKAFNIPGLQTSAVITSDEALRTRVAAGLNRDELTEPNAFAIEATVAAFTQGKAWLDQARVYIRRNKDRVESFVAAELPEVKVVASQATYLLWLDCGQLAGDTTEFCDFLRHSTGLYLNPGKMYGDKAGRFVRMNIGCPAKTLEDGLARLRTGVIAWQAR